MQRPAALGLMLCDQVIVDRANSKPTLVGLFDVLRSSQFPSLPRSVDAFATLTDGQGLIVLDLLVSRMDTQEVVAALSMEQDFPNPLALRHIRFGFRALSFPVPGSYLFELLAEGEPICHRRLRVRHSEE